MPKWRLSPTCPANSFKFSGGYPGLPGYAGHRERLLSNTIAAAIPQPDTDRREAVTRLLSAWQSGDARALERLTPLIYEELRDRARRYMKNERAGHTPQATAVVHEAFHELLDWHATFGGLAEFLEIDEAIHRTAERVGHDFDQGDPDHGVDAGSRLVH